MKGTQTILFCITGAANREVIRRLLDDAQMDGVACDDLEELVAKARTGAAVLLIDEGVLDRGYAELRDFLESQKEWSELPVLLLSGKLIGRGGKMLPEELRNLTLIERPVSQTSLLSHLRAALAARRRQYQMRDMIANLEELKGSLEHKVAERTADAEGRRKEAERSNAELQQFASVVSHDLREPLLVISRYLELLQKQNQDRLDETGRRFVDQSIASAQRMQSMINGILNYSRSGQSQLELEEVDLGDLVDEVCSSLELRITGAGAEIEVVEALPVIRCDRMQITQLFQNLISNGIKYRGERPPRITISSECRGRECQICVRDNGIGIDFEQVPNIFALFERAGREASHDGSGIGLAVCKKIVQRHGGIIWAESEVGKGTSIYFTLPLKPKNES